jgi:hypothetical protein
MKMFREMKRGASDQNQIKKKVTTTMMAREMIMQQ